MGISKRQQQLLDLTDGTDLRETIQDLYTYAKNMRTQRPDVQTHEEAKAAALEVLHLTAELIDQINYNDLSTKERKGLVDVLNGLREVKNYYVQNGLSLDWYVLYVWNTKNDLMRLHAACNLLVEAQSHPDRMVENTAPQPAVKTGLKFPTYRTKQKQIDTALDHLRETWEDAALRTLSTEDEFLINAVATSYLPDAWRLLQQLSKHSPLAKGKGEEMFLKQVVLMQEQVDDVLAKEATSVLSEMAAHTAFLEKRARENRASNLKLS